MPTTPLADEYFNRALRTVEGMPQQQMRVCYGVFARKAGVLCGMHDVLSLLNRRCEGPLIVRARTDGDSYPAHELVMTIDGPFGELVTLETEYLGMLSLSAGAANMAAIVANSAGVPIVDMSARHFPPALIGPIAVAAAVGGAAGTSTSAGHSEVHARFGVGDGRIRVGERDASAFGLYGSIPHALNAVYGGSSIESAAACHERNPDVPLTVLIDFEGRERDICEEAVRRFGSALHAVRLDTASHRVLQGGHERLDRALEMRILSQASDRAAAAAALARYGFGPGVTIEAAYAIRDLLDRLGSKHTKLVLSGGFNLDKVLAFKACKAPMDMIGTGSWVEFTPFTSDIIRVFENGAWMPRCKAGRREELVEPEELPVLLQK